MLSLLSIGGNSGAPGDSQLPDYKRPCTFSLPGRHICLISHPLLRILTHDPTNFYSPTWFHADLLSHPRNLPKAPLPLGLAGGPSQGLLWPLD